MIRILHVTTTLQTGGAEMMLLKLLSAKTQGWSPVVLSLQDEGTLGSRIRELGVPVYSLGLRPSAPNPLRALAILTLVRRIRPQVIQGWMPHGNLMASLAGLALRNRAPVLWNIHMSLYDLSSERRLTAAVIRLDALLSCHPAAIIYCGQTSAQQHEAFGYRAAKRVIIPNGFDCGMFHPDDNARRQVRIELGVESDAILVGLVGRYHPVKDHANFLRAARRVAQAHSEARFLLVGKGLTREEPVLMKAIAEQQLQDRIFLLGERPDMPRLTAAFDIACTSSWSEAFPSVIGEAMACGVPCVATDVGDSSYLIANTGEVVPPRDPAALAQGIRRLIDAGAERRRQLGTAARQRIESQFSLPSVVHRYEDLYRAHLENPQEACA